MPPKNSSSERGANVAKRSLSPSDEAEERGGKKNRADGADLKVAAFLFQRSLRLDDNKGFLTALEHYDKVLPVFCVDPRQADPALNPYHSAFCLGFMMEALQDLREKQLQSTHGSDLFMLLGNVHEELPPLLRANKVGTLLLNDDATPFAKKRLEQLRAALAPIDVKVAAVQNEYTLYPLGSGTTQSGTVLKIFTPFYNAVINKRVPAPVPVDAAVAARKLMRPDEMKGVNRADAAFALLRRHSKICEAATPGGRTEALRRLQNLDKSQSTYDKSRDFLLYNTSQLSPYIKFGCVSIREVWHDGCGKMASKGARDELKRQVIWREFYTHYFAAYPEELEWDRAVPKELPTLAPDAPELVKACYNELTTTGWLHNRGRMVLAGHLVHVRKYYWRQADVLFARYLVDYDPAQNAGGWKWIARQPEFKQLKPKVQQDKFDKPSPHVAQAVVVGEDKTAATNVAAGTYTDFWAKGKNKTAAVVARMSRRLVARG